MRKIRAWRETGGFYINCKTVSFLEFIFGGGKGRGMPFCMWSSLLVVVLGAML